MGIATPGDRLGIEPYQVFNFVMVVAVQDKNFTWNEQAGFFSVQAN